MLSYRFFTHCTKCVPAHLISSWIMIAKWILDHFFACKRLDFVSRLLRSFEWAVPASSLVRHLRYHFHRSLLGSISFTESQLTVFAEICAVMFLLWALFWSHLLHLRRLVSICLHRAQLWAWSAFLVEHVNIDRHTWHLLLFIVWRIGRESLWLCYILLVLLVTLFDVLILYSFSHFLIFSIS